jgi:hypothetical protein
VVDFDMTISSMLGFMFKWVIATIFVAICLALPLFFLLGLFGAFNK